MIGPLITAQSGNLATFSGVHPLCQSLTNHPHHQCIVFRGAKVSLVGLKSIPAVGIVMRREVVAQWIGVGDWSRRGLRLGGLGISV